ncbi:MAG: response regulator transcription factor [Marinospirillum sp.]|uniref:response regulator transcription factor n=1 Tax=Marinospirillum sp. TaxID=2183934 RepID=UPI0019F12623|nr:response regulator transcription factor [Marinospirillum sp.]MBE0508457.1 response regulator transcription factor [Marinospirillum sp.]
MSQQVAIIEDDMDQARLVASWLKAYGYNSSLYYSAEMFLEILDQPGKQFDLLLIDWLLPGMNGIELVKQLQQRTRTPKIFITHKDHEDDLATALHCGADDFVSKPLSRTVLIARIHAVMRRLEHQNPDLLPETRLKLNSQNQELLFFGQRLRLTASEFRLMELFTQMDGQLLNRQEIADSLWGNEEKAQDGRALDLLISRLRKKLSSLSPSPGKLVSQYGQGYTFQRY